MVSLMAQMHGDFNISEKIIETRLSFSQCTETLLGDRFGVDLLHVGIYKVEQTHDPSIPFETNMNMNTQCSSCEKR